MFAAAAAVVVFAISDDYVGVKGAASPSVRAYIKRNETVTAWDGQARLKPGDAVQLRVVPAGYTKINVVTSGRTLHEGPLDPKQEQPLPVSFVVDDAPGDERLTVIFSKASRSKEITLTFSKVQP